MGRRKRWIRFKKEFKGLDGWLQAHDELIDLLCEDNLNEEILSNEKAAKFYIYSRKISGGYNSMTSKYDYDYITESLSAGHYSTTPKLLEVEIDLNAL